MLSEIAENRQNSDRISKIAYGSGEIGSRLGLSEESGEVSQLRDSPVQSWRSETRSYGKINH